MNLLPTRPSREGEIIKKLDDLAKRITRLETRLCVFMELKGINPKERVEKRHGRR